MAANPYEHIIWSADVKSVDILMEWLDMMPELKYVKIDRAFVDDNGWDVFAQLEYRGIKVFDDAKISEIPIKLAAVAAVHVRKARPWMLNCMAGSLSNGRFDESSEDWDGLKLFAKTCLESGVRPCAVTVLTSKTRESVANEFNGRTSTDQVLFYAEQLQSAGFSDIVCSPQEAAAIRRDSHFDGIQLTTPGVRPIYSDTGDQARVMTPAMALAAGADRLVIGRPITNGPGTPAENLTIIAGEVAAAISQHNLASSL